MNRLAFALLLALAATAAQAQTAASIERCHNGESTMAIVDCLGRLGVDADRHLNVAYQAALKSIDPRGTQSLRESERAWLEYRNKRCRAISSGDGTITQIIAADCFLRMTKARAEELDGDAKGLAGN